jgi:hypothetical protein
MPQLAGQATLVAGTARTRLEASARVRGAVVDGSGEWPAWNATACSDVERPPACRQGRPAGTRETAEDCPRLRKIVERASSACNRTRNKRLRNAGNSGSGWWNDPWRHHARKAASTSQDPCAGTTGAFPHLRNSRCHVGEHHWFGAAGARLRKSFRRVGSEWAAWTGGSFRRFRRFRPPSRGSFRRLRRFRHDPALLRNSRYQVVGRGACHGSVRQAGVCATQFPGRQRGRKSSSGQAKRVCAIPATRSRGEARVRLGPRAARLRRSFPQLDRAAASPCRKRRNEFAQFPLPSRGARRGSPPKQPEAPGLRKPRKIAEDSGRWSDGCQVFVFAQGTRDRGTPETPEAEDGKTHDCPALTAPGHRRTARSPSAGGGPAAGRR